MGRAQNINASSPLLRAAPYDAGPVWIANPSPYDSFIHCTLPGFYRRTGAIHHVQQSHPHRPPRPPWRVTSQLTVDAARLRPLAIVRIDEPEAIPREVFSRSAKVSAMRER
jgi:hypothetical protein